MWTARSVCVLQSFQSADSERHDCGLRPEQIHTPRAPEAPPYTNRPVMASLAVSPRLAAMRPQAALSRGAPRSRAQRGCGTRATGASSIARGTGAVWSWRNSSAATSSARRLPCQINESRVQFVRKEGRDASS
jgi:hypothetical protein